MCHFSKIFARGLGPGAIAFALLGGSRVSAIAQAQTNEEGAVTPPSVIERVDAVYPSSVPLERGHTDVTLTVTVGPDGRVSAVDVAQDGGNELNQAATVAIRQWVFTPAKRNGVAVASRVRVPFHFAPPAPLPIAIEPIPKADLGAKPEVRPAATESQDVTVHGHVQPRAHGTSDYQIPIGALAVVPRKNTSDLLKLAPGIFLTNDGGEGHAEQVFLRGFDAREGQDLEFSVDGVPINDAGNLHGNGYADTHFIIPELVQSLRVVEGAFAPQQGNFAVAGSADFQLGLARRGLTTKYTTGSYGTKRLLLTWGPSDATSGTFAGVEYSTTDGFGQNRQAKRGAAIGQYEAALGGGVYRVTATAYDTVFNSAGVLRQDDYASGRKGFFDTEDAHQSGNTSARYSIALTYEKHKGDTDFTQQLFVIDRTMRLREDFTGLVNDVQYAIQSLHGQRGDLLDLNFNAVTVGAKGSARWRGRAFGLPQELELGYFARGDQTSSTQDRIQGSNDVAYKRDVDLDATLGDIGLYADANVKVFPWLGLRGGLRADLFTFDVINNCAVQNSVDFPSKSNPPGDASCLTRQEHGLYREPFQRSSAASGTVMPRGTVLLGPFDHFNFAGSYGEGVRSIDPIYVSQGLETPFIAIQAYEAGGSYARSFDDVSVVAKSVFFRTHVDRDLVFNETEGRNTLANGSTRTGWAGSFRVTGSFFDEAANVTLVKATFDDTHLLVPYVPDVVVRSDTAVFHDLPWKIGQSSMRAVVGYGLSYVGKRALPYGATSDTVFVSDAAASLGWSVWEIGLIATNLFGARYRLGEYNYVSDFNSASQPTLTPARHFSAGAPRELFLSLSATLGGT